jgi:hypothetical protein
MRAFHALEPDYQYVFHIRNDQLPRKGEIGNDIKLAGSKAATIVILKKDQRMVYGIGRCQWTYPFNRKLGRETATGRAKQALSGDVNPIDWMERGIAADFPGTMDPKEIYQMARNFAVELVNRISLRAAQNGFDLEDKNFVLDKK